MITNQSDNTSELGFSRAKKGALSALMVAGGWIASSGVSYLAYNAFVLKPGKLSAAFRALRYLVPFGRDESVDWATELAMARATLASGLVPAMGAGLTITAATYLALDYFGWLGMQDKTLRGTVLNDVDQLHEYIEKRLLQEKFENEDPNQKLTIWQRMEIGMMDRERKKKFLLGEYIELGREKIRFPQDFQYLHMAIVGASGIGKSQAIFPILDQARSYGHKACVVDYGGSYYRTFGRPGDIVLSLRDPRSVAWDFWHEDGLENERIAEVLIPTNPKGDDNWSEGARLIMADVLDSTSNAKDMWDLLKSKLDVFTSTLAADPENLAQVFVDEKAPKTAVGYRGNMLTRMRWLRELNQNTSGGKPFSLSEWAKGDDPRWVFLVVHDKDVEATTPLLTLWLEAVISGVVARDERVKNRHIWVSIDELAQLKKINSLKKFLTLGRKYSSTVLAGYQTEGQIEAIYGPDAPTVIDGFQTKIYGFLGNAKSAEEAAKSLGSAEIIQAQEGESIGKDSRTNLNRQLKTSQAVLGAEIQGLWRGEVFLRFPYCPPVKMTIPFRGWPTPNQGAIAVKARRRVRGAVPRPSAAAPLAGPVAPAPASTSGGVVQPGATTAPQTSATPPSTAAATAVGSPSAPPARSGAATQPAAFPTAASTALPSSPSKQGFRGGLAAYLQPTKGGNP